MITFSYLVFMLIIIFLISLKFKKQSKKDFNTIAKLRHQLYLANKENEKYRSIEKSIDRQREYKAVDIRANVEVLEAKHGKDVVNDFLADYIKQQEKKNVKDLGYKRGHA
ncbi:hypothetical protein [Enterococcus sp. AZ102]|uniref:hypothetical protein n=1 Tax=Enterococcus sp. AZ102 TaxID=2774865 RepID=UPI003F27F655